MVNLLDWANYNYNIVPLYINKNHDKTLQPWSSWEDVPILSKNEFVLSGENALTFYSLPMLYHNQLFSFRTSGTTGKYSNIYLKRADYNRSMLDLWFYRKKYYGINPGDKMCYFYTSYRDNEAYDFQEHKNQLGFSKKI